MPIKCKGWTSQQIEQVKNNIIPEGKNYAQCSYFCRVCFKRGFRPVRGYSPYLDPRGEEFSRMHNEGMSYADISDKVGISRQRVGVIVKTWESRKLSGTLGND